MTVSISVDDKEIRDRLEEAASKLKPGDIEWARTLVESVKPIFTALDVLFNDLDLEVKAIVESGALEAFCAFDYQSRAEEIVREIEKEFGLIPWYVRAWWKIRDPIVVFYSLLFDRIPTERFYGLARKHDSWRYEEYEWGKLEIPYVPWWKRVWWKMRGDI